MAGALWIGGKTILEAMFLMRALLETLFQKSFHELHNIDPLLVRLCDMALKMFKRFLFEFLILEYYYSITNFIWILLMIMIFLISFWSSLF